MLNEQGPNQGQQLNQSLKQVLKGLQTRLKTLDGSLSKPPLIQAQLKQEQGQYTITHNGNSVTFTTYEYNNIPGLSEVFKNVVVENNAEIQELGGTAQKALDQLNNDDQVRMLAVVTQEALKKIDACINLDHEALEVFSDLEDFFKTSLINLEEYAQVASKLSFDNIKLIIGRDNNLDLKSVLDAISPIKLALGRLETSELVDIFNRAAAGKTNDDAKQAFINALKDNQGGLGIILSSDVKTNNLGQTNKFQKAFNDAAGRLFDSCAKVAKKDSGTKAFSGNSPLEADQSNLGKIWEAIKIFILAIFTLGCVKTDRTKMDNEVKTFCELLKKHDASNQLVTNNAKNVSFAVNS